ncbi:hypothetical protein ACHAXA_011914 [Cyclostephanos tholiformis]|uniref:GH16 domain-containing protein n=1 Tax=Cyclostephanos tholiformis TaxID=382380 RepID=A0ABD3SCH7_9STRA
MFSPDDEHERTSLLASSSSSSSTAPRPRPDVASSLRRSTMTSNEIRAIKSRADRLVEDCLDDDDDDSRGALGRADVDYECDDASGGMFARDELGEVGVDHDDGPVSAEDLEMLSRTVAVIWPGLGDAGDRIAEGSTSSSPLSDRVHLSTIRLRDSVRRGGSGRLPRLPSHAEIEKGDGGEEGAKWTSPPPGMVMLPPRVICTLVIAVFVLTLIVAALLLGLGALAAGPPLQPVGEYRILEVQEGDDFWSYYDFYAGKDSAGSNGFITYVSRDVGEREGIIDVVTEVVPERRMIEIYEDGDVRGEVDWMAEDLAFLDQLSRLKAENIGKNASSAAGATKRANEGESTAEERKKVATKDTLRDQDAMSDSPPPRLEPFNPDDDSNNTGISTETFVIISSSPTPEGPRNSIRLEGLRRFNRGLFIIDLRHMPAGCGTWPAFWLTDEANWPVNGEIDIVEGVSYQDTAKTALHATKECLMDDVPEGSKTGSWDTAVGIPNKKTGIPDMTFRYAQNCFVYDPHQWINQGCVATDVKLEGRSLGVPLNANGGGVYALEWDPANRHIRTWVFSPHGRVPSNLRDALRTATNADVETRVAPDTNQWGLPYGYFPIGDGTNCPASHFRNMRLVINLAFCGSVAGNRYFMDCPQQFKKFKTCNEWVASNPDELKEAYWKIRGVYVYERAWERQWS